MRRKEAPETVQDRALATSIRADQAMEAASLDHQVDLLHDGDAAISEAQLLRDGEFYAGRRFDRRELALQYVNRRRRELERDGWTAS